MFCSGPRACLSFHPLRSSLPWLLLVVGLSAWSAWHALTVSLLSLADAPSLNSWSRFPSVLAIAQLSSICVIVVLLWESRRYGEVTALARRVVVSGELKESSEEMEKGSLHRSESQILT